METSLAVPPAIGMGPEEVSLGLYQSRWQSWATQGIQICQAGAESGQSYPSFDGVANHRAPRGQGVFNDRADGRLEQQRGVKVAILVGLHDVLQEPGLDDAAGTPNGRQLG